MVVVDKVLFLGTPEFAVASLRCLIDDPGLEVVGVITQPDRPAGRGQRLCAPPVKRLAQRHKIPLLQPAGLRRNREARTFLETVEPTLMTVVAFGQILPRAFFAYNELGALNVHASLLPAYRGAAPIQAALLNGDSETGISIMKIDGGLDTGDVLAQRAIAIDPDETFGQLESRLAHLGAELLVGTIYGYLRGDVKPIPQGDERVSLAPRIPKLQTRIDWRRPAVAIHNQVRALNPRPGAIARFRGQQLKIWGTRLTGKASSTSPGQVVEVGSTIRVSSGEGDLAVLELQLPGRPRCRALDFSNGRRLQPGEIFE